MNEEELTKSVNKISEIAFIDVFKINSQSLLKDKLERFKEFNNTDLINRLASAEVIIFIKQYLCCSDGDRVPKYYKHEEIATFAFKYFTSEEIFILLDKCYKEFDIVIAKEISNIEMRLNERLARLHNVHDINWANNLTRGTREPTHRINKPLAELKAFIFILELIRVKSPELDCGMLNHYIEDLRNKFDEMWESHRYYGSLKDFFEKANIKIDNIKSNSVAILEFSNTETNSDGDLVKTNDHVSTNDHVKRTSDLISKTLNIPVVAIPEKMKLYLVEDNKEDNSIDGLEV